MIEKVKIRRTRGWLKTYIFKTKIKQSDIMKKLILLGWMAVFIPCLFAATTPIKMAVFNGQSVDNALTMGQSVAMKEMLNASLVSNDQFIVLDHSEIDQAMKELQLPTEEKLTDTQIIQVASQAQADKLIVGVVSTVSSTDILVSLKLINVSQANIEEQKVKMTTPDKLFQVLPNLTQDLLKSYFKEDNKDLSTSSQPSVPDYEPEVITIQVKDGIEFKMIKVEGGSFMMGSDPNKDANYVNNELPAHKVTLSSYYIGEFEVTNELFDAVTPYNYEPYGTSKSPVTVVNLKYINSFLEKLNKLTGKNFNLPTEAQWEFAARGGNYSKGYIYSGSNNANEVAWYKSKTSHPVGLKKPNELGLYDMSGNVWEWCLDGYDFYYTAEETDPLIILENGRSTLRGGSYWNDSKSTRIARRIDGNPRSGDRRIGFRLCMPAE